ncbi:17498_t:CDS:1 [Acaulospora morrowiae]|uniref:17498_t:CDS:1 n=1 Tax=Acaulospora morrowiae TaxID=94023 RepID=A0A9N9DL59_9GLOM|nr:17498_t:CDS:1 [Acaulospora morrowiae]
MNVENSNVPNASDKPASTQKITPPMGPEPQEYSSSRQSQQEYSSVPSSQQQYSTVPTSQQQYSTVPTSQQEYSTVPTSQQEYSTVPTSQQEYSTVPYTQQEYSSVQFPQHFHEQQSSSGYAPPQGEAYSKSYETYYQQTSQPIPMQPIYPPQNPVIVTSAPAPPPVIVQTQRAPGIFSMNLI